jgi:hypothetical protein
MRSATSRRGLSTSHPTCATSLRRDARSPRVSANATRGRVIQRRVDADFPRVSEIENKRVVGARRRSSTSHRVESRSRLHP